MKINISKKQYWHLLRALYIADWIANANSIDDSEKDKEIDDLREYLYSFAKEMGYDEYVKYDNEYKKYFETNKLDDEPSIRQLIDTYDEHTFWEEMIDRLGDRDFFRKYTKDEILEMSREEYFDKRMECADYWEEEFEKHGVERLGVLKKGKNMKELRKMN